MGVFAYNTNVSKINEKLLQTKIIRRQLFWTTCPKRVSIFPAISTFLRQIKVTIVDFSKR